MTERLKSPLGRAICYSLGSGVMMGLVLYAVASLSPWKAIGIGAAWMLFAFCVEVNGWPKGVDETQGRSR